MLVVQTGHPIYSSYVNINGWQARYLRLLSDETKRKCDGRHPKICLEPAVVQCQLFFLRFVGRVDLKPPLLFRGKHDENKIFIAEGWVNFFPSSPAFLLKGRVAASLKSLVLNILHLNIFTHLKPRWSTERKKGSKLSPTNDV